MEIINDITRFVSTIQMSEKVNRNGYLLTQDKKNYLIVFDGIILIKTLIPDLEGRYNIPVNLDSLKEVCRHIIKKDKVWIDLFSSYIELKVVSNTIERKYKFPNIAHKNIDEKIIDGFEKINPVNIIGICLNDFIEEINRLSFTGNDKFIKKVSLILQDNEFIIEDDNKYKGDSSINLKLPLPDLSDIKSDEKVKINWIKLKDSLDYLSKMVKGILIFIQSEKPIKIIAKESDYEITIILAPIIEGE